MTAEYITTKELAEVMRMSEQTLRHWRRARIGPPFVKFGRRVLYPRDGFSVWARAQQVGA